MTNQEIGRSLASSFVEMAQALDLLPKVEADLADAKAELDKAKSRIRFLESHNTELGDKVVELEAKYADATKSATGHKTNVDIMLEEVQRVIEHLTTAVEIVTPRPKPEVALPNPLTSIGQSAPMTGEATSHQTAVGGDSEQPAPGTVNQSPFVEATSPSGSGPNDGDRSGGQSDVNPTASTGPDSSVTIHTSVPDMDAVPATSNEPKPDPRPYWLKPSNMTWADWKATNGDVPSWVSEEMMHDHLA